MPTMRIRRDWRGESRLGRLAMDLASSVSVPLSAVPPEISRLVLESLMHFQIPWRHCRRALAPRLLVTRERRHVGLQVLTSRAWGKPKQISGNFAKTFSSLFWSFAGFGIRKLPFAGVDKAIGLNPGLARVEFKIASPVVE